MTRAAKVTAVPPASERGTTQQPEQRARRTTALRRFCAVLVMMVVGGLGVAVAGPASAAGTSAPDVRFCLTYSNGAAYASKPVYLYRWNGAQWVHVRSGASASNGCGTWVDVTPNAYYYVRGYWAYSVGSAGYYYDGNTGAKFVGNAYDGLYHAGYGKVGGAYRLY